MRALYLRIYLTVVAVLALFALVSGWVMQRHFERERDRFVAAAQERAAAWGELLQRSLPGAEAPVEVQAAALSDWSERLRLPLALEDAKGHHIGASESYLHREFDGFPGARRVQAVQFEDGRTLLILSSRSRPGPSAGDAPPHPPPDGDGWLAPLPPGGLGLAALLMLLFTAVAAGAWPVVRRLTRRLEALKNGVEAFGAGALHQRVAEDGQDEVAALGASFNRAATRIEALLHSHQSLLANASHELRSPLARLKMAVSMIEEAPAAQREALRREIHANIAELDALVDEVLLASRLDAGAAMPRSEPVDLLALAAEEASRSQAGVDGESVLAAGDERLLRRALRNLLENAQRYGGDHADIVVQRSASGQAEVLVCDRGPGVPEAYRERIFEAFFRLPGHAEREGGVGLGLALVRQIAAAHGGNVRCEAREGGGSCFRLTLPAA